MRIQLVRMTFLLLMLPTALLMSVAVLILPASPQLMRLLHVLHGLRLAALANRMTAISWHKDVHLVSTLLQIMILP